MYALTLSQIYEYRETLLLIRLKLKSNETLSSDQEHSSQSKFRESTHCFERKQSMI